MPPAVAPTSPALDLQVRPLGRALTLGALVAALQDGTRPFVLSGRWGLPEDAPLGARVVIAGCNPSHVLTDDDDPFDAIERVAPITGGPAGAVGGGYVGWFGYDLSRSVERTLGAQPHRPTPLPAANLAWYDDVLRQDPDGTWWVEALCPAGAGEAAIHAALDRWRARLDAAPQHPRPGALGPMRPAGGGGAAHRAAVAEAIERIYAGELFQANVCLRLEGELRGSVGGLVAPVLERTDPWYGAWIDAGAARAILSASPELFLRRRGREVTTGPIKGTLPRPDGSVTDPAADPVAARLLASAKDQAEHVMIVDLMRNDLGRVCDYGSIRPDIAPTAEPHAGVWHLVSAVRGRLHEGLGDGRLVRATFPPGSVTGAPKVQAMRVIAAVEGTGREVYTGAHGLCSPVSGLDLAVTIRTLELRGTQAWIGVGGGIVADSDPQGEYEEALGKAAALVAAAGSALDLPTGPEPGRGARALPWMPSAARRPDPADGLIETTGIRDGRLVHAASHRARLAASAQVLGLALPADLDARIDRALAEAGLDEGRLRVELAPGHLLVEAVPSQPVPADGLLLSPVVVPGGLGPHKWRDRHLLAELASLASGTPLLVDADGSALEAAWANLWWEDADGTLVTPPADGRLLPGIMRAALLTSSRHRTAQAPPPSLAELAERPLLVSSARGFSAAHLAATPREARQRAAALAAALNEALPPDPCAAA